MSEYTKSTNFASKDSLSSGDSLKIVKGTEIDTEFNNIATAVATKANLNSPTFIGTPVAPTASSGTNTTQLATTAFVTGALQSLYPVGSIYINAGVSTNPNTLLGFGTWTAFGAGRVMVGLDSSDALFDGLEETGGSKNAVVVSHTHTATVTDPGHTHLVGWDADFVGSTNDTNGARPVSSTVANVVKSNTTGITVSNSTVGSSATNANLPPYITVAMWKRTA